MHLLFSLKWKRKYIFFLFSNSVFDLWLLSVKEDFLTAHTCTEIDLLSTRRVIICHLFCNRLWGNHLCWYVCSHWFGLTSKKSTLWSRHLQYEENLEVRIYSWRPWKDFRLYIHSCYWRIMKLRVPLKVTMSLLVYIWLCCH